MGLHNLTTGCYIVFEEAVFSGHWRNADFDGYRTIGGTIVKESYGAKTGQHSFTILVDLLEGSQSDKYAVGQKIRRMGRNIYPLLEQVIYPDTYEELAADKRLRSKLAKEKRADAWAAGVAA